MVHLRTLVTENEIVDRVQKLKTAAESQTLSTFCEQKSAEAEKGDSDSDSATAASWKVLLNLFNAGDREELITLLSFSKEMTAKQVADAVKAHKRAPSLRARAFQVAQSSTNEENALHPHRFAHRTCPLPNPNEMKLSPNHKAEKDTHLRRVLNRSEGRILRHLS